MAMDLPPQIRERTVAKARTLLEALPFMREHHGKVIVVKYGGAAMDRAGLAASFAEDIALLQSAGITPGGRARRRPAGHASCRRGSGSRPPSSTGCA